MCASLNKTGQPFGLWESPITPQMVSRRVRLEDVRWDSDGQTLVWLESRSGRSVLVAQQGCEARRDLTEEQNVRGGVGYGGGEFAVADGVLIFAAGDGSLYRRTMAFDPPRRVSPPFGGAAAPALSPDGRWVAYVYSDGDTDLLALAGADGNDWPVQLARGADFYMQPVWHPAGDRLAWVEWDHPNMPWDGARLVLGRLEGEPLRLVEQNVLAGGPDWPLSQPAFSPNGDLLAYIDSRGEWDRLVLVDLKTGRERTLLQDVEAHLALPPWVQGMRSYGWNPGGTAIYSIRNRAGVSTLWRVGAETGQAEEINISPYLWITQLSVSPKADAVAFLASAPTVPERIVRLEGEQLQVVARSDAENIAPGLLPSPEAISWKGEGGEQVYGLYYPPTNPNYDPEGLPPAIVHVHSGPTSQATTRFSVETAYFTSRGYAWLEVNYRGSSGYGRTYQKALLRRWGEADVEDVVAAAQALEDLNLADASRLVLYGSSAGGFTVLNTLARHPGVFKAGVSLYGISNFFTLLRPAFKFEAHYNESLIGSLPADMARYYACSAVFHADHISDPIALFHGAEDRVIPAAQSEEIAAVLQRNRVPHLFKVYSGEGHSFRKAETLQDFLQETTRFLQQHVLFTP